MGDGRMIHAGSHHGPGAWGYTDARSGRAGDAGNVVWRGFRRRRDRRVIGTACAGDANANCFHKWNKETSALEQARLDLAGIALR